VWDGAGVQGMGQLPTRCLALVSYPPPWRALYPAARREVGLGRDVQGPHAPTLLRIVGDVAKERLQRAESVSGYGVRVRGATSARPRRPVANST
jgi:hypothetical protein